MFDYTPVGLAIAAAGVLFLAVGYRLLPSGQTPAMAMGETLDIQAYVTEVRVPDGSPAVGKTIASLGGKDEDEVLVTTVLRDGRPFAGLAANTKLREGDIVLL